MRELDDVVDEMEAVFDSLDVVLARRRVLLEDFRHLGQNEIGRRIEENQAARERCLAALDVIGNRFILVATQAVEAGEGQAVAAYQARILARAGEVNAGWERFTKVAAAAIASEFLDGI